MILEEKDDINGTEQRQLYPSKGKKIGALGHKTSSLCFYFLQFSPLLYSKLQKGNVMASSLFLLFEILADLNANHMLPQGCAFMFGLKNENIVSGHFLVALHFKTGP